MKRDLWLMWNINDGGSNEDVDFSETLDIVKIIKMQIQHCFCFAYLISN